MNTRPTLGDVFTPDVLVKPENDIKNIIETLAPFSHRFTASRGEILRFTVNGKKTCYLLHSGSINIIRRGDGVVLHSEPAPALFGTTSLITLADNIYIRVTEDAQISRLSLERFNLVIESFGLWENLCKTLIYNVSIVFDHCSRIAQMSSHELITYQLKQLMKESERVRLTVTAANYISSRTYLSRSSIMRILAELRDSGHITLHRGILINMQNINVL
jgi:CRP-like cAMP-binding protein